MSQIRTMHGADDQPMASTIPSCPTVFDRHCVVADAEPQWCHHAQMASWLGGVSSPSRFALDWFGESTDFRSMALALLAWIV
jgi:hypothetical protein